MMKNIYLVQANALYGDDKKNTYIPYAVGCLAAYAFADKEIKEEYKLGKFVYTRQNIKDTVNSFDRPFLVGFSSNVWNSEYNKALAKAVKEKYPDCITVFGGHQIPPDADVAFKEYENADILIHGGGEEAFRDILLALKKDTGLQEVKNISVKLSETKHYSTERMLPDTPDYPSPYLEGIFDPILDDGIEFSAIIETNRGCPNNCAFCDWGTLRAKVRKFDLQKVYDELLWLARHKIEYVYCADANFGLFDRDMDITNKFIELKNKYGYPAKLKVNFTKNRCEFVGEISRKLNESNIGKSQTLSFQSVDKKVLDAIGRKNIDLPYFEKLLTLYAKSDIPTYSELILGLPEETYESFSKGLCDLLESGQHKSINIYPCELLPNSRLGSKEYVEKYKIKTTRLPFKQFHCEDTSDDVTEYSFLITSTDTMTSRQWVDSYFFALMIQSFHCLDIIRESAIFARHNFDISYLQFYTSLADFAFSEKSVYLNNIFTKMKNHLTGVANAQNSIGIYDDRFGKISYEPDENLFLNCIYDPTALYDELTAFLSSLIPDTKIAEALISYQKAVLNLPEKRDFSLVFPMDFPTYFEKLSNGEKVQPVKKDTLIEFSSPRFTDTWAQYARECVWYGRRNEGMHMRTKSVVLNSK